jgi:hypothetical protein
MAKPVFYIRGLPSSLATSEEGLLVDLKAIVDLSDDSLNQIYKNLNEAQGFLNPKAMLSIMSKVLKNTEVAEALLRIIINVNASQVEQVGTFLDKKSKEEDFPFNQQQLECLKLILKKIIQPYPALIRYQKAERLTEITGQQLETVELICDIRPIFDESRKNIEGMIPYTRLHIVATGEDGLPNAFEVELSYQQVLNLSEKTEKAKFKLESLRQSIENWLPEGIPDLPLTRIPQKESKGA